LSGHAAEGDEDIRVIINSPGGHVESGDTIHDLIRFVVPRVRMIGTGWVASAGAHIFLGARKENRYCLPNTRFLLHQPTGGVHGPASDISIEAEEILKMHERINRIIARETGQPFEKVVTDTDRNFWIGAEDAVAYGLISRIVSRSDEL
jgi:ATP-dependent Clp protease, protease subunit